MTLSTRKTLREPTAAPLSAIPHRQSAEQADNIPAAPERVAAKSSRRWKSVLLPRRTVSMKESLGSFACSALVHGLVLLGLGCFIWNSTEHELIGIVGGFAGPEDLTADPFIDSELALDPGGSSIPVEMVSVSDQLTSENSRTEIPALPGGVGAGTGTGEGDGTASELSAPMVRIPDSAVTKGSFTAWTEPEDPVPYKDYIIIIRVQLPSNIQKYRARDISGLVIGTDGWKQPIRFPSSQVLQPEEGAVFFQVKVPGARQLVRDTVRIESKLLKEKQVLNLEF